MDLASDAWLVLDAKGEICGYDAALPWGKRMRLAVYDDPGTEDTRLFLGLLILCEKRAVNILREMHDPKKRTIATHISDPVKYQKDIFEEAGYTIKKFIFNMHMDLTGVQAEQPELPSGVIVRCMRAGHDERALHGLIQAAFDWTERDAQPYEEWINFMMRPDIFHEELWFLAEKDDELIGACLGFSYEDLGWVRQFAVVKSYQGQGLGRALLLCAFRAFKERGYEQAGLAVESVNKNACRFYEKVGMYEAVHLDKYVQNFPGY